MSVMMVRCEHLAKAYPLPGGGTRRALKGICLEVPRGEIFGLLGPNGAGKTTLIKILLGFTRADAGAFALNGSAGATASSRLGIGYVPDGPIFHAFARARSVLAWHAELAGLGKAEMAPAIERVAQKVGLSSVLHQRLESFSKGMLQRLALAQALLGDPDLLIMDEPTGGLDPLAIEAFRALLRQLREEGKTVLLSTHLLSLAEGLCDRVAVLHRGEVVLNGALPDLLGNAVGTTLRVEGYSPEKREALSALLAAEGIRLKSAEPVRPSLEACFLELLRSHEKDGQS